MTNKAKAAEFADETYQIHVIGRNVLVTDAMKNYVLEKITKVEKFSNHIIEVNVTLDIQKLDHICDIVLKVGHTKIRCEASSEDMYASIDLAMDKLHHQLSRWKTKITDHHNRPLGKIDMNVNVLRPHREDDLKEINDQIEEKSIQQEIETYRPHQIVDRRTRPMLSLTYDEAIMKMELSQDAFLIFRAEDEKDHGIKVIYRHDDGDYGVIDVNI
ncbi:MAG: ribosome-associated translation inhibitor RaiA [Chlamydiia bacterium]|nr:ribosome-associated translation inhibitor RaiA [Chlamydiia bacterium]